MTNSSPATTSGEYNKRSADRKLMHDVTSGLPAIIAAGEEYLTKWHDEDRTSYDRRLKSSVWTPLFNDILHGLASKPFAREISVEGEVTSFVKDFIEDVDGEGNSLHQFGETFFRGVVRDGRAAIMVDHPPSEPGLTLADETARGLRPYWVMVEDVNLIAVYKKRVGGRDVITHARILERTVEQVEWEEVEVERVRVMEPGQWWLFRKSKGLDNTYKWEMESNGTYSLGIVPLVVYDIGPEPPLVHIARMQIELFRKENNLKTILNRTAFPVYFANGMIAPTDGVGITVGPGVVLYGGAGGSWEIAEPDGSCIQQVRADIESHMEEMRRLGMQPLLPKVGGITATATGVEAAKAHSAVQMWALGFKNTLENALALTGQWVKEEAEAEVIVHTDFGVDLKNPEDTQTLVELRSMGEISRMTLLDEMKRRGVLAPDFDPDENEEALTEEKALLMEETAVALEAGLEAAPPEPVPGPGDLPA